MGANQERGNPEIHRSIAFLGGVAIKKSDLKHAIAHHRAMQNLPDNTAEAGGYPDYTVTLSGLGFYIEGKGPQAGRIPFSVFDRQRRRLDELADASYVWLWLGDEPPQRDNGREAYLIDWPAWRAFEQTALAAGYKSVSFDGEYPARDHLAAYQLEWAGNQTWRIPYTNPFWAQRLAAARFFVARCERVFITGEPYDQLLGSERAPADLFAAGAPVAFLDLTTA